MTKEELFSEIEQLCVHVFKQEGCDTDGMRGYNGKMKTYAFTAFTIAARGHGIRLKEISEYLDMSISNTTRLRLAYGARFEKDPVFRELMDEFLKKKVIFENTLKTSSTDEK